MNLRWKLLTYGEIKELCKAAKYWEGITILQQLCATFTSRFDTSWLKVCNDSVVLPNTIYTVGRGMEKIIESIATRLCWWSIMGSINNWPSCWRRSTKSTLQTQAVGQGTAEALATMQIIPQGLQWQGPSPCYECGKHGHFRRDCLQWGAKPKVPTCPRCKKDYHHTNQFCSKHGGYGKLPLGNFQWSIGKSHVMTHTHWPLMPATTGSQVAHSFSILSQGYQQPCIQEPGWSWQVQSQKCLLISLHMLYLLANLGPKIGPVNCWF